jgi:hypothetical protein
LDAPLATKEPGKDGDDDDDDGDGEPEEDANKHTSSPIAFLTGRLWSRSSKDMDVGDDASGGVWATLGLRRTSRVTNVDTGDGDDDDDDDDDDDGEDDDGE